MPIAEKPLELQPHLTMPPGIDATERHLLRLFLRRYVTYCASGAGSPQCRALRGSSLSVENQPFMDVGPVARRHT